MPTSLLRRPQRAAAPTGRGRSVLRRSAVLTAGLLAVTAAPALAQVAAPAFTVGTPQPELNLFQVGPWSGASNGQGIVLPDGNLVLVADLSDGTSAGVCLIHPGERGCAVTTVLQSGEDVFGNPEVVSLGGSEISVILDATGPESGLISWVSTDDGASFGPEIVNADSTNLAAEIYGVTAATVVDGQVVVADNNPHSGLEVQAFDPTTTTPPGGLATINGDGYDASVTPYDGGLLVASDDGTNAHVYYAPAGSDFNNSASYGEVASLPNQTVEGISGTALLTQPTGTITTEGYLYLFNGSGYGAGHKVPEPVNGDDTSAQLQQTGGVNHVFYLNRRNGYDIYEESTVGGVNWSRQILHTGITSGEFAPVLGPTGAGLYFEGSASPLLAQPILNAQFVHVHLVRSSIRVGTTTTLRGTVVPHVAGLTVRLQREFAGRWYTIAVTHENAAGRFSFKVSGTRTFRAVVANEPGYLLFGYSNHATLVSYQPL